MLIIRSLIALAAASALLAPAHAADRRHPIDVYPVHTRANLGGQTGYQIPGCTNYRIDPDNGRVVQVCKEDAKTFFFVRGVTSDTPSPSPDSDSDK